MTRLIYSSALNSATAVIDGSTISFFFHDSKYEDNSPFFIAAMLGFATMMLLLSLSAMLLRDTNE